MADALRSTAAQTPITATLALLRSESIDLRAVVIYAAAAGLLSLAVPVAVQSLVNQVAFTALQQPLVVLSLVVLVALALQGLLAVLQFVTVELIQRRLMMRAALTLADGLAEVRQDALEEHDGPELANRFFDVVTMQKAAATLLLDGIALALQLALGLLLLALYHPTLLGFAAALVVLLLAVVFGLGRNTVRTAIGESKAKYAVAAWLEEVARHRLLFSSQEGREFAAGQLHERTRDYLTYRKKHFSVVLRQVTGLKTLHAVAGAGLLAVGGALVLQKQLTLGQLVAAELLLSAVLQSVAKLGKHLESWYDLVAAVDKLEHVAALPREKRGGELLAGISAAQVEFIDVSVRRGSRQVLKGVQALWRPGSRVALLGPSGGGKSTLAQLLQGVCHPELGRVCLDGVEVGALDLAHLRSLVAVVRSGDVFQGTILDNIALGRSDIGPAEVRAALAAVGLLEDVQALPKGLATSLRGLGAPLSLGQVRRLALARAIAVRPRLLVLDEVLDGLASAARDQAWQAVAAEHAPWTLVVLTHQREVAERCEEIWSLEQGRLERLSASDDGEGRAK
jgi:ABC-type bacteriocin/lantibiotic exporter with double-glycine peptidase domain